MTPPARVRKVASTIGRDEGSTLLLTIFYGFLSLALVLVVVAVTSLYLERKRLFSVADSAALVGAEAFAIRDVSITDDGPRVVLVTQDVRAAVIEHLDAVPTDQFDSLVLEHAGSLDGRSATVTLSSYWRPPVVSVFVPDGVLIEVTAVARTVFSG